MDNKIKSDAKVNMITIWVGILVALIALDLLFIYLSNNEVQTINLDNKELKILQQDQRIISASTEITNKYHKEIDAISGVFPDEENIPIFIQTLESLIKNTTDEYSFKFSSLTPVADQDKLFLLLSITMKTDMEHFQSFLDNLEKFPYMIHVTGISEKTPIGFNEKGEINLGLKLYVQNPFSAN
jgi:hypothetical protein